MLCLYTEDMIPLTCMFSFVSWKLQSARTRSSHEGPEALEKFMSDERRIKIKLGAACKTFFGPGSKLNKSKARDAFIQIYVNLDNLIFYFWQLVTQHNWCLRCRYLIKEFVCRRMKIELCWKMTEWRLIRSFWRISKLLWFP